MRFFPGASFFLKRATFIDFWYFKIRIKNFQLSFLLAMYKRVKLSAFKEGLRLFKGLSLQAVIEFKKKFFNFLALWLCIKESNYLLFKRGLRLFKGLCLLFLKNIPGAMFIQGGSFIPDSRVLFELCLFWYLVQSN